MTHPEMRLKYVATLNNESLGEDTAPDYELQYIDIGNVDSSGSVHEIASYRFADAPSRARRRVRRGDVIVSCVRTYLQAIAPIESPPDNLIVSTGFAVVRPIEGKLRPGFCKYALREPHFLAEVERRSVGVSYPAINSSDLAAIPIPAPPDNVQLQIEEFLDRETARLDVLVAAKQRVLDLLTEKRKATIASAVTRGLDPKVKLRDSGVPWLAEIPAHWTAMRVRHLGTLKGGAGFPHEHQGRLEGEIPFFKVKDLGDAEEPMLATNNYVSPETAAELRAHVFPSKTVVFAKVGAALLLNRFRVLGVSGCIDNNMMGLSLYENRICVEFAVAALSLLDFRIVANPGAVPSINEGQVSEYRLPVPPLDEQRTIAEHIASETAKVDVVRAATERTIALLKERRSALIAAAVTGQLDVEAAA